MGWVSTSEDIDELRQENEHYRASIDNLILGLQAPRSTADIRDAESNLVDLSHRLIAVFEEKKEQAQRLFNEAIALLQDPSTRIAARIEKRTHERDELRGQLEVARTQLHSARSSQSKALDRVRELELELARLRDQLLRSEDELALREEFRDVRKLRDK